MSSTGQFSTRRWPGGRRWEWAAVLPVSSLPSSAHCCLLSISLFLSLPNKVTSSSAMSRTSDGAARLFPVGRAQFAFEYLARILAREGRAELDRPGHFVACHPLPQPRLHPCGIEAGAPLGIRHRLDVSTDPLAELLVRDAEHGAIAHAGHLDEHRFDFRRIDVHAARDDHVALAIAEEEIAVGIEIAHVAHGHQF